MSWKDQFPKENRYFETDSGILYNAEAIEMMSRFPEKIFDAIITDPPYGTTACKWDSIIPIDEMWRELKKVRKDRTAIVLFGSEPFSSLLRVSNLEEFRYDWVWEKEQGANFLSVRFQPYKVHEVISVFGKRAVKYYPIMSRGEPYISGKGTSGEITGNVVKIQTRNEGTRFPRSIIRFNTDKCRSMHPTQKPVTLLEYLVKTYTKERDLVLDFAIGSGTTAVACEKLNRRWIGIEIEKKYCDICVERLRKIEKYLI